MLAEWILLSQANRAYNFDEDDFAVEVTVEPFKFSPSEPVAFELSQLRKNFIILSP